LGIKKKIVIFFKKGLFLMQKRKAFQPKMAKTRRQKLYKQPNVQLYFQTFLNFIFVRNKVKNSRKNFWALTPPKNIADFVKKNAFLRKMRLPNCQKMFRTKYKH
jgi:hypothetical protein